MPAEGLAHTLEMHARWIATSGREGRRADLSKQDLKGAALQNADLRFAILSDANLTGANLREAKLDGADLARALLEGADLTGASLRRAVLTGAQISTAIGIEPMNVGGAVVSAAKLPASMQFIDSRRVLDECIKSCRTMWIVMLTACLYCLLTVAATTDANLLLPLGSSKLDRERRRASWQGERRSAARDRRRRRAYEEGDAIARALAVVIAAARQSFRQATNAFCSVSQAATTGKPESLQLTLPSASEQRIRIR